VPLRLPEAARAAGTAPATTLVRMARAQRWEAS